MPTQILPLDPSSAYTFCLVCKSQGNPNSLLQRDGHILRCALGHQPSRGQLEQSDMVKAGEVFHETPTITDVKWSVWVNPKVREKLESKFSGRLMITLGTYLAALADDSMIILTGEEAAKLRKLGVHNGKEMLASIEGGKVAERERDEAVKSVEKFMGILNAAGGE